MPPTLLKGPDGQVISAEEGKAAELMSRGFVPYTTADVETGVREAAAKPRDRGVLGSLNAAASAGLSGLTLGASDVLLSSVLSIEERDRLAEDRRANPGISAGAELAGNVLPALATGGAVTPAGALSKVGQGIVARTAEGGAARAIAGAAAGAAVEGAGQAGGAYLAQTALENKPLSAEGFVGAMGAGALFGAGAGAALGVSERALMKARSLFPKSEITRESAQAVEREATDALRGALDDGTAMQQVAARELEAAKLKATQDRLAAGAVPDEMIVDEVAPGRVNWAIDRAERAAAKKSPPRRAFDTQPGSAPAAAQPAAPAPGAPPLSWREFQAQRMAEAMRAEGGHAAAMKRIGKEWQEYKAGIAAPAAEAGLPSPAADVQPAREGTSVGRPAGDVDAILGARPSGGTAQRAVFDFGPQPARPVGQAPLEATAQVRGVPAAAADEILGGAKAPPDIDALLERAGRAHGIDLGPPREPVIPRGEVPPAAPGSLEEQLRAMAAKADEGVPLREMREPAAPAAPPPSSAPASAPPPAFGEIEAVRVGRPSEGRLEMRIRRPGAAEPEVISGKRDEIEAAVEKALPEGFNAGPLQMHRDFKIAAGIPATADDIAENAVYVVRPSEFVDRGVMGNELHPSSLERVTEKWGAGERLQPIDAFMTSDGKIYVEDGNHRLAIAARDNRPVVVRFRKAGPRWEPQEHAIDITDRVAAELPRPTPAGPAAAEADAAIASIAPRRQAIADVANEIVAAADPRAAKILDASRKEAAARAEVEALFAQGTPAQRTMIGRPALEPGAPPRTGTMPWQELEAMKARGQAPATPRAASVAPPPAATAEEWMAARGIKPAEYPAYRDMAERAVAEEGAAYARRGAPAVAGDAAPARELPSQADLAAELRGAVGKLPEGAAWVPVSTPEGGYVGASPVLGDLTPATAVARKGAAARAAEEILGQAAPEPAAQIAAEIDDQIAQALGKRVGHMVPMGDDLADAARKISAHEESLAELAEALGPAAPPAAVERAAKLRAAQAAAADAHGAAQAQAAEALASHAVPDAVAKGGGDAVKGGLGRLADLGAGLEVLKIMGVHVPDIEKIPVIGPVLGVYLKARAALGIWKRAGGAVPKSLEGMIASKAATTQDRAAAAVRQMLELGAKGARKAMPAASGIGGLAHKLFEGAAEREAKGTKAAKGDPVAQYHQRLDELARAAAPGAIEAAVQRRVPTSDPALLQEIVASTRRKLAFLDARAPRPPAIPAMLRGDGEWRPSKEQLAKWGRYVEAAEDPAAVLEHVAAGHAVSMEAAETLRTVYPALFETARLALVKGAAAMENTLPYQRRVALSILFQVPTDRTTTAQHVQFLQQGGAAAGAGAAPPPGQGSPAGGAPPTPTIAGPVAIGDRVMTRLDRRAGA